MRYNSLRNYLSSAHSSGSAGPIAVIVVEDDVEIASTFRHHADLGFKTIIALVPSGVELPPEVPEVVSVVSHETTGSAPIESAINRIIEASPEQWIFYCFNAEYLFFPFCETRSVGEMLAFHKEERRHAMLTCVVDLYAKDLTQYDNGVSLEEAYLDGSGYYALARKDPEKDYAPKDRQLDIFGGLRWRFEEHVPETRRRVDRIGIFRANPGLKLRHDHTLNEEEYNTFSCPWHHNLTAVICSFRAAKALKRNPGSRDQIDTFFWRKSEPFQWHSQQLLDMGMMEPGQWY